MLDSVAIYYSRLSTISRSRGQSAVAAAAYRCGGKLKDERLDRVHDYRRKGGVLNARMLAPADASWALDTGTLWNQAESAEVRCNARTARELIVALPAELSSDAQIELAHAIAQDLVDGYRVAVLVAVHAPDKSGDDRNVHVHLLMTTREVHAEGLGPKTRVLDDKTTGPAEAERMRDGIAARINAALKRVGVNASVDPRPLAVQAKEAAERGDLDAVVRLTRAPTRHQGVSATAAARKGRFSPVVHDNRRVQRDNRTVAWHGRAMANRYRSESGLPSVPRSPPPRGSSSRPTSAVASSHGTGSGHVSRTRDPVEQYMQAIQADARQLELSVSDQLRAPRALTAQYAHLGDWWRSARVELVRRDQAARVLDFPELKWADAGTTLTKHQGRVAEPRSAQTEAGQPKGLTRRQWAEYRRALRRADASPSAAEPPCLDESALYESRESVRVTEVRQESDRARSPSSKALRAGPPNRVTARRVPGLRAPAKPPAPKPAPGRRRRAP